MRFAIPFFTLLCCASLMLASFSVTHATIPEDSAAPAIDYPAPSQDSAVPLPSSVSEEAQRTDEQHECSFTDDILGSSFPYLVIQSLIIIFLLFNVHRRLRAEAALRRSKQKYKHIFDNAMEGIFQVTPEGRIIDYNQAMMRLLGYSEGEVPNGTTLDLAKLFYVHPERREHLYYELGRHGSVAEFEVQLQRKTGEIFWGAITANASTDNDGNIKVVEGILTDITPRKKTDQAIKKALEVTERASRMKSDFLSSISHELKTPLTSIMGFSKIARKRIDRIINAKAKSCLNSECMGEAKRVSESIGIIHEKSIHLTSLIESLIDLAKLEKGNVEWSMAPVAPYVLVMDSIVEMHLIQVISKRLYLDIPDTLPDIVCDKSRISEVIHKLLDNALKFAPHSAIHISAEVQGHERQGQDILFTVRDSGPGIPEDSLQSIFSRFRQLGDTLTEKPGGVGLGLSICREIITIHGGNIWAENRPEGGLKISFTLPCDGE